LGFVRELFRDVLMSLHYPVTSSFDQGGHHSMSGCMNSVLWNINSSVPYCKAKSNVEFASPSPPIYLVYM
jgi:hypothetical protein